MKKKILIASFLLLLVVSIASTAFATSSYSSTFAFRAAVNGTPRTYNGGTKMCINCWSTYVDVYGDDLAEFTWVNGSDPKYGVTCYKDLVVDTSYGRVGGWDAQSATTYNYKWTGAGPGSGKSAKYFYRFDEDSIDNWILPEGKVSSERCEVHGHCTMYSE